MQVAKDLKLGEKIQTVVQKEHLGGFTYDYNLRTTIDGRHCVVLYKLQSYFHARISAFQVVN